MKNLTTIHSREYRALIDWLVAQRKAKRIRTHELADLVGIERSIISKIENYVRRLDVAEYIQFCNAIDIDPTEGIRVFEENKP